MLFRSKMLFMVMKQAQRTMVFQDGYGVSSQYHLLYLFSTKKEEEILLKKYLEKILQVFLVVTGGQHTKYSRRNLEFCFKDVGRMLFEK